MGLFSFFKRKKKETADKAPPPASSGTEAAAAEKARVEKARIETEYTLIDSGNVKELVSLQQADKDKRYMLSIAAAEITAVNYSRKAVYDALFAAGDMPGLTPEINKKIVDTFNLMAQDFTLHRKDVKQSITEAFNAVKAHPTLPKEVVELVAGAENVMGVAAEEVAASRNYYAGVISNMALHNRIPYDLAMDRLRSTAFNVKIRPRLAPPAP